MKVTLFFLLSIFPFLATADIIKSYYQEGSAPKYYKDNEALKGIGVDYIQQLNTFLSVKNSEVALPTGANFSRIKKDLLDGKIDIFFGITKTAEREAIYDYGQPLYAIQYAFAVNDTNTINYQTTQELDRKKIGVISGTRSAKFLEKNYKNFESIKVDSIEQALKMLKTGRLDAAFYHDLGLNYQIKRLDFSSAIKVVSSSAEPRFQYFAYHKGLSQTTKDIVNDAFSEIIKQGHQQKILEKYGVHKNFVKVTQ